MKLRIGLLAVLFVTSTAVAVDGYYRSPSLRGDTVAFTAEGDLWLYDLGSKQAKRLTTHPALETNASISLDEKQIVFVSDYEGVAEAYVMPMSGGVPRRLTYENERVFIQGWTPDGRVLYSTGSRVGAPYNMTLKIVNPANLEVEFVPLADAFDGAIDPDTGDIFFTQFGLQWSGDNATIYRGGMRGKLWRYQPGPNSEASRLTPEHVGSARRPMTEGDKLYFLSDASGRDNLWSVNLDGTGATQVTHHEDFSIRGASLDNGRLVYQLGADLHLLDLSSLESRRLEIQLTSDHPGMRESWVNEPLKFLTATRLAGSDEKVTLTARGKIAIAGIDQERLVSVATPHHSRMRNAALSRDGEWVYAISDAEGELELWRYDATGATSAEQMTQGGSTLRGKFFESPNGKWIVHDDGDGGLWLLNTRTRNNTKIVSDSSIGQQFGNVGWAPDSKAFAVSHRGKHDARPRIQLHSVDDGTHAFLTSDKYESWAPTFSQDGKWLYYLSNRHFESKNGSVWADRDFGPSFDDRTEVYAHALTTDAEFPFKVPNELTVDNAEDGDDEENDAAKDLDIEIVWEGLSSRVWQVPVAAGNYIDIAINKGFLYLLTASNDDSEIKVLKLEPQAEPATFTDSAIEIELSDDRTKLLVTKMMGEDISMFIVPAEETFPEDVSKNTVQTDGWQFSIDPRAEWQQIFHDAWLMHREQFFDPAMRGLDWDAMKGKYEPMLLRVTDRHELNDVLAQMMGELNALHSGVRGGDVATDPEAPSPSILGAKLRQTQRGIEISHIYHHDTEVPAEAPPLAKPGVDAVDGDIIVAINGTEIKTLEMLHRSLRNQSGKQVFLTLKRGREEIKTVVVPGDTGQDRQFRYHDWVNNNRLKVEAADSDLGYLHIQAMGAGDVAAFARDFYASDKKKGMVIDVRRNDGGNVDSWIIDRLLRKAWMFWSDRNDDVSANMQNAFRGHLVVIADEGTYSDGETFTAAIKALGIAPVIGKRTAGAGVWLTGSNYLADFGIARVAEFPVYAMDGRWIVEGHGVSPTIEVDNLPHATYEGKDAQLEAAISYLQQKIQDEPIPELKARPFPEYGQPAEDVTN
ncbi:MAG: PD40 domain-containing protein [Proteobacteria bacterium]|nr:PD40 domain-containing protein [Pseudomonadota bacterium]